MKQQLKRLVSVALSLVIVFAAGSFPASAAGEVTSAGNWWSYAVENNKKGGYDFIGQVIGLLSDACSISQDGKHHGYAKKKKNINPLDKTWIAVCSDCSKEFEVSSDQFKENYDQYTTQLKNQYGATNIGKDGMSRIYLTGWTYEFSGMDFVEKTLSEYPYFSGVPLDVSSPYVIIKSDMINVPISGVYNVVFPASKSSGFSIIPNIANSFGLSRYKLSGGLDGSVGNYNVSFTSGFSVSMSLSVLYSYQFNQYFWFKGVSSKQYCEFSIYRPYIEGVQLFSSDSTEASTNTTRPGSMSGNFGQLVNGNITQLENSNNIINETTNTYYNPITNTTSSITDWNYDYSDRSYNITTNEGDKIYVTYGDENITIKEGDTIYNIYYMYPEDSGGGDPDPKPDPDPDPPGECVHTYTEEITTAPSCLSGGIKTFTCSKCQKTYTEKLPAAGHNWAVDRTVNTTYDENGAVITEGYTIYKCTGCGNEYKDSEGKGPPAEEEKPDPGGNIFTWLFDLITGFFSWIVSMFTVAVESIQLIISKVSGLLTSIPAMFSGFTAFLKEGFGFIPSDIIVIITLGVVTMVVVGVLKLLLK